MLIQLKNKIILLEAVSYAAIEFPGEDTENDWIEPLIIVDGHDIILTGDDALQFWHAVSRNALSLPQSPQNGQAAKLQSLVHREF